MSEPILEIRFDESGVLAKDRREIGPGEIGIRKITKDDNMNNDITTFNGMKMRVSTNDKGERVMAAIDIAKGLGYKDAESSALKILSRNKDRFKDCISQDSLSGLHGSNVANFLNLEGMIDFCLISKRAEALPFQKWARKELAAKITEISELSFAEIMHNALLIADKKVNELKLLNNEQKKDIDRMEPKEESFDMFLSIEGWMPITNAGKLLGYGPNRVQRYVETHFGTTRNGKKEIKEPWAKDGKLRYMPTTVETDGRKWLDFKLMISTKGINYLAKRLKKEWG